MFLAKKDSIEQLIQIVHEQNAWYIGVIGITIALFGLLFGVFQWKYSNKQLEKVKEDTKTDIAKEQDFAKKEFRLKQVEQMNEQLLRGETNQKESLVQIVSANVSFKLIHLFSLTGVDNQSRVIECVELIEQDIGFIVSSGLDKKTINKYLHLLVNELDKFSDFPRTQENSYLSEACIKINRSLTFISVWDSNYSEEK